MIWMKPKHRSPWDRPGPAAAYIERLVKSMAHKEITAKILSWILRLTVWAVVFGTYAAAVAVANHFGPTLQVEAFVTFLLIATCIAGALYHAGRKNFVGAWRCVYFAPAILLAFVAYLNFGFTWIENHVMARAEVEERFHALRDEIVPAPSAEWTAKVERDWVIAQAQREYEAKLAALGRSTSTPFHGTLTPWLYAGAGLFLCIALLPTRWILTAQ